VDLARSNLMYAAALPGRLRSADAIHLAAAIRPETDVMVAYDAGLLAAAVDAGLNVRSPGNREAGSQREVIRPPRLLLHRLSVVAFNVGLPVGHATPHEGHHGLLRDQFPA
jgi:hypothetical protein